MKTIQVIGAGKSGGAETFYVRFVLALKKRSDVLPVVKEGSWVQDRLKGEGVEYKALPFGGFFDFRTKSELKKLIAEHKPDIVMGWMNRACKFIPKLNVPTVGRMGGYYSLKYYKTCDYIVGNTQKICDYLMDKGVSSNRVKYLTNFTSSPTENYKAQRDTIRAQFDLPLDSKVLLVAGRLHENKGIDVALQALKELDKNTYLIVAGNDSGQEQNLRDLSAVNGLGSRVRFVGWVSDISQLAAAADIWLVPSRWEPLGNTVLDAWMHKLPCVSCKSAGPSSLIEAQKTGLLVELEDSAAMAQAVKNIFKDEQLSKSLKENGYKQVQENYSEDVVMNQFVGFFQEISKENK